MSPDQCIRTNRSGQNKNPAIRSITGCTRCRFLLLPRISRISMLRGQYGVTPAEEGAMQDMIIV